MALLGGPVGAVLLAGSALAYFATRATDAERESEALEGRINALGGAFDSLGPKQAKAALIDYNKQLVAAKYSAIEAEVKVFSLNQQLLKNPRSPLADELAKAEGAAEKQMGKFANYQRALISLMLGQTVQM